MAFLTVDAAEILAFATAFSYHAITSTIEIFALAASRHVSSGRFAINILNPAD